MNKVKIAYFVKNMNVPSQTFVRSLIKSLSNECELKVFEYQNGTAVRRAYYGAIRKINKIKSVLFDGSDLLEANFLVSYAELKKSLTRQVREIDNFSPDVFFADFGRMGLVLAEEAIRRGKPIIIHFHGNDASEQLKCNTYVGRLRLILSNSLVYIIVPSNHLGRMLQIACGSALRYSKIPYGPEIEQFERSSVTHDGSFRLLSVGRLVPKKNPLALIEAFRVAAEQEGNLILDIVGDGPLMSDVEERIRQLQLSDKITLHGRKSHDYCLKLMDRADLYVQHSVTDFNGDQEGLPNSILEALLLKTPVVSTLHSGIPEAVEDGRNGYLVPEHNFIEMGEKIVKAVNRNKDSWLFDRVSEYTPDERLKEVMKLIKKVNI